MKKYNVTVNGVLYEVMVEEATGTPAAYVPAAAPAPSVQPTAPAPAVAPAAPAQSAQPAAPKSSAGAGSIKVSAPMPGTILKLAVKVGDSIKAGDLVCVLEAMKMENEIFASEGGTVQSVDVAQGASVNSGDTIITLA